MALDIDDPNVGDVINRVLSWAEEHPRFDTSFVISLQDQHERGRTLSPLQIAALYKIIDKWNIYVDDV